MIRHQALPITPYISDNIGRRPTLFIGSCIMFAGALLQALAMSIGTFIGARGMSRFRFKCTTRCILTISLSVGFGLTFGLNAAPLLITELAYPTQVRAMQTSELPQLNPHYQRGKLTASYNASWYVGSIICEHTFTRNLLFLCTDPRNESRMGSLRSVQRRSELELVVADTHARTGPRAAVAAHAHLVKCLFRGHAQFN